MCYPRDPEKKIGRAKKRGLESSQRLSIIFVRSEWWAFSVRNLTTNREMKQYYTEYQKIKLVNSPVDGADLGGGGRGAPPPSPPPRDDLRLSNTTGIL